MIFNILILPVDDDEHSMNYFITKSIFVKLYQVSQKSVIVWKRRLFTRHLIYYKSPPDGITAISFLLVYFFPVVFTFEFVYSE